jgi:taurine dioxygenase
MQTADQQPPVEAPLHIEIRENDMFHITPRAGTIGAQIDGIDLSHPLGDARDKLVAALDDYKVLVFHDQHKVGPRQLLDFASNFGAPETAEHPVLQQHPDVPGVFVIVSDAADPAIAGDSWHTDGATRESTAWVTFLQSVDVPPYGRDTLFADGEAIYDSLSDPMKAFLDDKKAVQAWGKYKPDAPGIEHPVVTANPRTGRKRLYVNRMYTQAIVGLHPDESAHLLEFLFGLARVPEVQFRVNWGPATIVLWDNESTSHYGVRDYAYRRVQHRVMALRDG